MSGLLSLWHFAERSVATSEEQLLQSARRGDKDALGALYRRHASGAYTLALRLCGDVDRANDVVQDAFLRAFDRLHQLREAEQFLPWLKRIVATVAIDHVRRDRKFVYSDDAYEQSDPHAAPIAQQHDALGLLAQLPAAGRTVLVLYELEGYSHLEIGGMLGRNEVWSKTVLSRARRRLAVLAHRHA